MILARNWNPENWGCVPDPPCDPAWTHCYVRRGESLRDAIRRQCRREDVSVGLRVGPDGRAYAVLRLLPDRDLDDYTHDYRVRAEREAVWLRLPAAVDRAVRERGPSGNHEGLGFTLRIGHKFLFSHWGLWK